MGNPRASDQWQICHRRQSYPQDCCWRRLRFRTNARKAYGLVQWPLEIEQSDEDQQGLSEVRTHGTCGRKEGRRRTETSLGATPGSNVSTGCLGRKHCQFRDFIQSLTRDLVRNLYMLVMYWCHRDGQEARPCPRSLYSLGCLSVGMINPGHHLRHATKSNGLTQ